MFTESENVQYQSSRNSWSFIEHSQRSKIKVSGTDRVRFLQNILTNDLSRAVAGEIVNAALLDATSKIQAMFSVHFFNDFMVLESSMQKNGQLIALLDRFLITEDVTLEDITDSTVHWCFLGPKSHFPVRELFALEPPEKNLSFKFDDTLNIVSRQDMGSLKCFHLWFDFAGIDEKLKKLNTLEAQVLTENVETALRLEEGVYRFGKEISNEVMLSETGYEKLIASQTKGCYPGQEVVAKIETYGRLNRKISRFLTESKCALSKNERILTSKGQDIGWIETAIASPFYGKTLICCYLVKGFYDMRGTLGLKAPFVGEISSID